MDPREELCAHATFGVNIDPDHAFVSHPILYWPPFRVPDHRLWHRRLVKKDAGPVAPARVVAWRQSDEVLNFLICHAHVNTLKVLSIDGRARPEYPDSNAAEKDDDQGAEK